MTENSNRGFGAINDQEQREISSKGGQSSSGNRNQSDSGHSKRGLASADRQTRERVASEGGKAAHEQGTAHEWNRDEAREAGREGGQSVSRDKEHMSKIGREGGQSSHGGGRQ